MKNYIVKMSDITEQDLETIISYIRYDLGEDIIADKYKILFKQKLKELEKIAPSMPILDKELTGYNNIRKVNVKKYIIFYIIEEEKNIVYIVRIGHAFMDWEKYLKD